MADLRPPFERTNHSHQSPFSDRNGLLMGIARRDTNENSVAHLDTV